MSGPRGGAGSRWRTAFLLLVCVLFLRDSGIRVGNSYDGLLRAKRRDPKTKLWNFYDYHFSPAGHVVIAEEMFRFLGPILGRRD